MRFNTQDIAWILRCINLSSMVFYAARLHSAFCCNLSIYIVHRERGMSWTQCDDSLETTIRCSDSSDSESRSARWLHHKSVFAISSSLVECLRSMGDLDSFRKHSPDINVFHPSNCIVRRKIAKYISLYRILVIRM